ncbi:MAG: sulfatase [Phycisphaeraceae bacterium]|nr:sulfatase [Phycisphaeraceae bacterium]
MKAVVLMFDSLNRHMLPPYGCDWTVAPNFKRLAERTVTFERSYVCSMPCMPARRDFHTGRPNFLHRSWGPLEPFDDSVPRILRENRVYSHLASDHYHYWEEGSGNYHTKYSTWECFRGQEGDPWIGQVADPFEPEAIPQERQKDRVWSNWRQDWINRACMKREEDQPQVKTISAGIDFMRRNLEQDNWLLQIETFDPHEPFFTQQKYKDLYPHKYTGKHFDWPAYRKVTESREELEHCRLEYAALLSMCDAQLGRVLDAMDELKLWDDTMLVVWTDHGFMLGEHDCWAKCWQPWYQELANTPFFVWDPRCRTRAERRTALVQPAIDLGPTLLEYFGLAPTPDMLGRPLAQAVADDTPVREAAIFGLHGGHVNVTDGRYVYMRGPSGMVNGPVYQYTLMPAHMKAAFSPNELKTAQMHPGFSFTKGCPVMRTGHGGHWVGRNADRLPTMLFDLQEDPREERPLQDPQVVQRMTDHLVRLMRQADAPPEQYERLGVPAEIAT